MAPAKLIKSNPESKSEVWEFDNHFRKKWLYKDEPWLEKHYEMLKDTCGDVYVKNFGFNETEMWLDTNKLPGKLATTFDFTPEFIERISRFCLEQYKKTKPFAHFDWDLNNIIISDNNISLVDWDNYGMYSEGQVLDKMKADLKKSFGDKLIENIWVQPAAGDAGGSLGAALAYWYRELNKPRKEFKDQMQGSFLGPCFNKDIIQDKLNKLKATFKKKESKEKNYERDQYFEESKTSQQH